MDATRRRTGRGFRNPYNHGSCASPGSLIKDDGVSLTLRENQVASNAREAGRFGHSGHAEGSDVAPNPFRKDAVDGPPWAVGTMAVPTVPPFDDRLDAGAPRRGERATRKAPVPPRGLGPVFEWGSERELPSRLLRMSHRPVGLAPRCADTSAFEEGEMKGRGPP